MKKRLILLSILFFSALIQAHATGRQVRGVVVDAFTGAPLEGVTILVTASKPTLSAMSDEKGEFNLDAPEPGRWTFTASRIGYQSASFNNTMVISGKDTYLTFKLMEKVQNLKAVVVSNTPKNDRPLNETARISARSFSVEQTERFAGSLGDPARMVTAFAGVVVGNDSRNDIIIRGNSPMGLLWKIEGVDVPNPNHFGAQGTTGGPVSMLNSNLLSNSDFMTGAFPAEYGNALSGVFDLNMRSGNKERLEFTGQVGFNGFEAAAEGPLHLGKNNPKGSFLIDYRYSTLQLMSKMGLNAGTGSAVPEYNDLTILADVPTLHAGRFRFFGLVGNSFIRLNRSFDITEATAHSQVGFATDFGASLGVGILTHTWIKNENTRIKTALSYQSSGSTTLSDSIDYSNKKYFTEYAGKLGENRWVLTSTVRHRVNSSNLLMGGFTISRYQTSYHDSVWERKKDRFSMLTNVEKAPSVLYQAFGNWSHSIGSDITLIAGLHSQYYTLGRDVSLEPRTSLEWHPDEHNRVTIGYGLHSQIQPRSVYFYTNPDASGKQYSTVNRSLGFTRSNQFVAGYEWFSGKDFRIKSEAYAQFLYDVPVSDTYKTFSLLNVGSGYYVEKLDSLRNKGTGTNYGMEITIEKFLNHGYYALLTVSLYDSKYKGTDHIRRNTAFNSNFAANLLTGYEWKVGKKNFLTLDLRSVWSGGMRYIPIDLQKSIASGEQTMNYAHSYENKYSDYFRTDLRIGFKQNMGSVSQEWGLDLQNITNHKNFYSEQYNPTLKEICTVYQQGFMPMMLYRVNF